MTRTGYDVVLAAMAQQPRPLCPPLQV